jgi:O-methyltransferase
MIYLDRKRDDFIYTHDDYFRLSSLELVAHEIKEKNIPGCVAELGVYKGNFAKYINVSFPDRKLFLFDTFEGFPEQDRQKDTEKGFSFQKKGHLSGTSVELVLKKMKYPENCIVKKGYFPETAKDINENFVFVSIDTDLFEPIYNGLCYFYPKLHLGGYIFVHDYGFDMKYRGAKAAIIKYTTENKIPYFPLSDKWGSVVIMK